MSEESSDFHGLEEISIRNLGVIESAVVEFKSGLNVLTGETGAGKTMVLTALGLITGGKADSDRVRAGSDRLMASGRFTVPAHVTEMVAELDGELEGNSLLISRTVTSDGKSKASLGGTPTTASKVSDVAAELLEIHGQSSTQRLFKPHFIRSVVDRYGNLEPALKKVTELFHSYKVLDSRISQLINDQKNRESEVKKLEEFLKEFRALEPEAGELDALENELVRLGSVDELQQAVATALNLVDSEDSAVSMALGAASRNLDHVSGKDAELDEINSTLGELSFQLQEQVSALHRYLSALDADPARLSYLQERKSGINSLIKKYGVGSDRQLAFDLILKEVEEAAERIADLQGGDNRIADLQKELQAIFGELKVAALALSSARATICQKLAEAITFEVHELAMRHARVLLQLECSPAISISDFTESGIDDISLLFTSHEGANPGLLTKVASGGELSRVLLAIEVVLAAVNPVSTYVFDEVDAGVGGKAAIEVGKRLRRLANHSQVIVVTHLAQVAVWADHHLVVKKSEGGSVSVSDVYSLDMAQREVEIARMLSGQEDSVSAQEHARELLIMARESVIS